MRNGVPLDCTPPSYEELDYVPAAIKTGMHAVLLLLVKLDCLLECHCWSGDAADQLSRVRSCDRRLSRCHRPPQLPVPDPRSTMPLSSVLLHFFFGPGAGEVPVVDVSYAADGQADVRTSIGSPVAARKHLPSAAKGSTAAAVAPAGAPANGRSSGSGTLVLQAGGAAGGRYLQLLLLASCFMAALAAVGTYTSMAGLSWLS